ncbi:MAG: hypothetical protein KC502_20160 [Myxococcales bacterium]|nr:hypothetical protein [Myxococcales bacterium]
MASPSAVARLKRSAGLGVPVVATRSIAEIDGVLREFLCARGVNVLVIAGGDGTVHHVVNALLRLQARHCQVLGQPDRSNPHRAVPLPRLLIVNGGTLNIVGRTVGIHGPPHHTLRRFIRYFRLAPLKRVPARMVPVMAVSAEGDDVPRFGFVFGSETVFHAIELYVRFGAGYGGLSRFIAELARGAVLGSELWREEGWKLGPFGHCLHVDETAYPDYTAVVASTVDLTLAIAAVRAIRRPLGATGFHAKIIMESSPLALVRLIPKLISERPGTGIVDVPQGKELRLRGPYTLDGECFDAQTDPRLPLVVQVEDEALPLVSGEFGATRW